MERKIGEIFEYNGEWYQCVEQPEKYDKTVCAICDFHGIGNCELDKCSGTYRSDKKSVIFKKLEKVGAPYIIGNKLIQRYKMYPTTYHINVYGWYYHNLDVKSWTIDIEIKQNKEDMEDLDKIKVRDYTKVEELNVMEENKLNLKPFDLQKAKLGKPVCTRDGRKARIICFDRRLFYKNVSYPILALVECSDGEDDVCGYNEKGKVLIEDGAEYKDDLMMLPEKKEGWVNVYKGGLLDTKSYPTQKEAFDKSCPEGYVDTVKICWEE